MDTMDCTDIKALLSGLVDGVVPDGQRHVAERHLAGCGTCRGLLDEAEAVNRLIVLDAESGGRDGLPPGFMAAVLDRTVHAGTRDGGRGGLTNWLGWLAAAASLLLAASLWVTNGPMAPSRGPAALDRIAEAPSPATVTRTTYLRSAILDLEDEHLPIREDAGTRGSAWPEGAGVILGAGSAAGTTDRMVGAGNAASRLTPALAMRPRLTRDDAEMLDSASLLLEMLLAGGGRGFARIEEIRRIAEYDELLPGLAAARERSHPADRPAILASESVLHRIMYGPLDNRDLQDLRSTVEVLGLPRRLATISGQWAPPSSL